MYMNLIRLQRFLAVYRNESFSRAADELGMTHSALTKSVQLLEQELAPNCSTERRVSCNPPERGTGWRRARRNCSPLPRKWGRKQY